MSEHQFLVTVTVDDWPENPGLDRTAAMYAQDALLTAGLPDARVLDGFADLTAAADVSDVQPWD